MASTSGPTQSGAIVTGSKQFREPRRHRLQAHLGIRLALRAAEVARQYHAGAVVERVLDGGQRSLDALVAGDLLAARREGNVEIDTNEDTLVLQSRSRIDNFVDMWVKLQGITI